MTHDARFGLDIYYKGIINGRGFLSKAGMTLS